LARRQNAKFWELRAAMSMARLWRDQGKRDEARELLAPIYGWYGALSALDYDHPWRDQVTKGVAIRCSGP
jgi:hypothetical protein